MARKALLVGINYPNTDHALRGCVNDVMMVSEMLTREFGFSAKEKRVITDESATTANIMERLNWLVEGAQPGDILHFHYSGHGSQMIDSKYDSDEEPDGLDEIICPIDLNWRDKVITDDMLKEVFDRVPSGVHLSIVLDCCHSGTGLDHSFHYRPLGIAAKGREFGQDSPNRARLLPMPADIENRGMGLNLKPRVRQVRSEDKSGLLISGCQAHQTSADAWINNMYCGAATFAFLRSLALNNYSASHKKVVDDMNQFMVETGFSQRPELNGDEDLLNMEVLGGKKLVGIDGNDTSEVIEDAPTIPEEPEPQPQPEVIVTPEPEVDAPEPQPQPEVIVTPEPPATVPVVENPWKRNLVIIALIAAAVVAGVFIIL